MNKNLSHQVIDRSLYGKLKEMSLKSIYRLIKEKGSLIRRIKLHRTV